MAIPVLEPRQEPERWQRFTLLDLFLIQLGVAIGFSLAAALRPPVYADWPFVVIAGAILGPVFCGPIVLFVQWFFRGRNARLSTGEWLWLSPCLVHMPAVGLALFGAAFPAPAFVAAILLAWFLAQMICSGLAGLVILSVVAGTRPAVPCLWTDRAGSLIGLFSNLFVCLGPMASALIMP